MFQVRVGLEAVPDFLTEKTFCKLEDEVHRPGQVQEMDVFVSHGQSSLTTAKRLGDLGWGPDREVAPAHVFLVEDVGKSSHLVFLVVKKSLECHDVGSHQVTHGVFGGVEGCGLREDDPPAVLVPLWQHEDVASRHQVRYGRVPAVQVLEPGGILASHGQIFVQDSAGLLAVEFLHPQETENEVGVKSGSSNVRLVFYPFSNICQGFLSLFVSFVELILSYFLYVFW